MLAMGFGAIGFVVLLIAYTLFRSVVSMALGYLIGIMLTWLPGIGEALEVGPITEDMLPVILAWAFLFGSVFKPNGLKAFIEKVEPDAKNEED